MYGLVYYTRALFYQMSVIIHRHGYAHRPTLAELMLWLVKMVNKLVKVFSAI